MRRVRLLAVAATSAFVALVGMLGIESAGAHSDQGVLAVEAATAPEGHKVAVTAILKYVNDGDAVTGADVSVFATNAADEATAPVTLTDVGLGGYQGSLKLPAAGTWTLHVRAEDPAASETTTVTVTDQGDQTLGNVPSVPEPVDSDDDDSTIRIFAIAVIAIAL